MDPKLQAAVLTIHRQASWERENAHRWPALRDVTAARIATHEHALAALAGAWSYVDGDALVYAALAEPEPYGLTGPDDDEDDDEDQLATPGWRDQPWQTSEVVRAAYTQAELDTQAAPMGGWEPRS